MQTKASFLWEKNCGELFNVATDSEEMISLLMQMDDNKLFAKTKNIIGKPNTDSENIQSR